MSQQQTTLDYLFPILKPDELLPIVHDIWPELIISDNDFTRPQSERWKKCYLHMLQSMTGTNSEQFTLLQFHQSRQLDYPELYEDATSLISFTMALQRLMYACCVKDFHLTDLTDPKPKRTQRFVSALVNYFRFMSEKQEVYEQMKAEDAAIKEQHQQLTTLNDELQQKINAIRCKRAEEEPEYKQLQESFAEMNAKMGEHHKQQMTQQKAISDLKAGIAETTAANDQTKLTMLSLKEKSTKLSRQIVQSPDRMKNEIERQRRHLASMKTAKEEKISRMMELREQEGHLVQLEGDCEQANRLIQGINGEIEREREVLGEISNLRNDIQTQKDVLRDLTAQEQRQKQMVVSKQEKLAKLSLQHQNRMAGTEQTLVQMKGKKEQYGQMIGEDDLRKSELEHEMLQVEQQCSVKVGHIEKNITTLQTDYSQLLETLDAYHEKLASQWENVSNVLQES